MTENTENLTQTPLHALHVSHGGRMVPFGGYSMPVQFEGIIAEHQWTRSHAGLFDVSHMGQRIVSGPDHESVARAVQAFTPGLFTALKPGGMRYTVLLNEGGGIVDDLIVTRPADRAQDGQLMLVVNAGRKDVDDAFITGQLPDAVTYTKSDDRALLALQGPLAETVLARHCPQAAALTFMTATHATFDGMACHISRSGYTGEDGYEISMAAGDAQAFAQALLAEPDVKPIGLGARDSLRLEAGMPLYGHHIDETTSPVEAGLTFAISKARREAADFPGAERILSELADGPVRKRVGLTPAGRAPVREGAMILAPGNGESDGDTEIGKITSGGFGPTIGGPVAMGYVDPDFSAVGTELQVAGRRGPEPATVTDLPFVPASYKR